MNRWTSAAKEELERYLSAIRRPLEQAGADAAEVMEDIRRHIEEEITAARLRVVTVTDLRPMLGRIGSPWMQFDAGDRVARLNSEDWSESRDGGEVVEGEFEGHEERDEARAVEPMQKRETKPVREHTKPPPPGRFLFLCGVVYPAVTLLIEWITGFCAETFFNPIPTLGHVFLVAFVPVVNGTLWFALQRDRELKRARHWGWLLGLAAGISVVYSIVFLPLVLPGLIALLFFGMGLLPLTPLVTLSSTISLRKHLRRKLEWRQAPRMRHFWPGMAGAALAFLLVDLPFVGTTVGLHRAAVQNASENAGAVRWLRNFGHEETLLRACYPTGRNSSNFAPLLYWLLPQEYQATQEQAQRVYFQVYGRAFNSAPAPGPRSANPLPRALMGEPWDPERGGQKVGAPVQGLSMQSSRIDATVEPGAALAYLEWIFEFRNDSRFQAEARSEILLPPGASVSRLTLWINGEEREAAFAGSSQVREAYQAIVAQRRDPVLVTSSGKDLIMMQCFPVPPNGGVMKVRIGMTAPLPLDAEKNGLLRWPIVRERNFANGEKLEHSFWIDSPLPVESFNIGLKQERTSSGHYMARGILNGKQEWGIQPAVLIRRDGAPEESWAIDTRGGDGAYIVQRIVSSTAPAKRQIVLVLDGSAAMAELARAWEGKPLSFGTSVRTIIASDPIQEFTINSPADWKSMLAKADFEGGQDNIPALEKAWDAAAEGGAGAIIWVHGPQPILLGSANGLAQRFERRPGAVELFDIQVERGRNEILAALPSLARWQSVPMHQEVSTTLTALVKELSGQTVRYEAVRERIQSREAPEGAEASLHLVRAWAADEIKRLVRAGRRSQAVTMAGLYQLVSEVSGAVVLETAQQYESAGLQPVDASTVPTVPEPGTWALMIVGAAILVLGRRFQGRRRAT